MKPKIPWLMLLTLFLVISVIALASYKLISPVSQDQVSPAEAMPQLKQPAKLPASALPSPTATSSASPEQVLGEMDSLQFGDFSIKNPEQ